MAYGYTVDQIKSLYGTVNKMKDASIGLLGPDLLGSVPEPGPSLKPAIPGGTVADEPNLPRSPKT